MPNLRLRRKKDLSPFRKIAIGTWATSYDPSVYGTITLRMEQALDYLEAFRQATGKRLTLTHMMARTAAAVLAEMPDANAILRFNRLYLRDRVGVFLQVAMRDEATGEVDLSGTVVYDAHQKPLAQIVEEVESKVGRVRDGQDRKLQGTRAAFRRVPPMLLNPALKSISFLSYALNLDLRWAGVPRDPFGSIMITNIGSLGLEQAYVPLVPWSRVPLLLAMGAVEDAPVVDNGQVVPGKVMRVSATFDHRLLDGAHAARMASMMKRWMEQPFEHFDAIDRPH